MGRFERRRRSGLRKSDTELVGAVAIWILSLVQSMYWPLLAYALAFFAVPWARKKLYDRWNVGA
jgi:hypothetical protein